MTTFEQLTRMCRDAKLHDWNGLTEEVNGVSVTALFGPGGLYVSVDGSAFAVARDERHARLIAFVNVMRIVSATRRTTTRLRRSDDNLSRALSDIFRNTREYLEMDERDSEFGRSVSHHGTARYEARVIAGTYGFDSLGVLIVEAEERTSSKWVHFTDELAYLQVVEAHCAPRLS